MRNLWLMALAVLMLPPALAAQREYGLQEPFHVTVPLRPGGGSQSYLELRVREAPDRASATLEASVGRGVQRLDLPTWPTNLLGRGSVLVADFNFDGFTDFTVPEDIGYGGVNYFHGLYVYDPRGRRFVRLASPAPDYGPTWCNPSVNEKTRTLETECRSGPAWYGLDFRFERGKPRVHIRATLAALSGFLGPEDDYVYLLEIAGRPPVLSAGMHTVVPVVRRVSAARAYLFDAPRNGAITKRYVVKGDAVRVLEVRGGWCRVSYRSRTAGVLVKWLDLRDQGLQLLPLR